MVDYLLDIGIALRSRGVSCRRCSVRLFVIAQLFISAGVASAQNMKVACVGDSITAPSTGWCRYLGMKLGSGYTAQTFGVSGTTLLKNVGQPAFSSSSQYKPSHDFAPNIVVIMLGTNDSASRNWSAGKDHFVKDYEELIDSYTSLATKPTVFLNTPPPASDDNMFTISGTTIEKEINPLIKQVAMTKRCPLVDVWAAFDGDVEKLGSFDGVHPGDGGQMTIAETVYQAIKSPNIPGGSAGVGGSAGAGGSAGVGGSASSSGAGGGGGNTSGAGGVSANTGGAGGGTAGGSANSGAGGSSGRSANTGGSTSLAGAGGGPSAGSTSSTVNAGGVGGSAPVVTSAESSSGACQTAGTFTSKGRPTPVLILLLGSALILGRKRNQLMHRRMTKAIVRLSVVVLTFISAGAANAQTKVACIGDSITALPSSWCGNLSTKLGTGYKVSNFGVSGTNLAKGVSQPYWDSAQYTPSHTFAPNIVIIMLGTNDAFSFSWSGAKSHFVTDYEELLDTYTSLASKPKPYMIIPTPIGTSPFGHDGDLLATEVVPLVKQVAMEKMVPTIDAFTLFGGAMFDTSLYSASDQVHPNAKGQQKIADEVYKVLMSTGALGGSAGAGGSAGGAGSGNAGAGGTAMAGSGGMAGGSATAGAAGGAAGTMNASGAGGGGANAGGSAGSGGRANAAGSTGLAGAAGTANAGSNSSTVNGAGAAGSTPVATAPDASDGGCRTAGNSTSSSGPTAALLLLAGLAIRGRRREDREMRGRQAAKIEND